MAKLLFGMNQSLDGYVDHDKFAPDPVLFQHFIEQTRSVTGSLYGRQMYEIMRYWDEDDPTWGPEERAYAEGWRGTPKWVVSGTLEAVGPNATLIKDDLEMAVRALKQQHPGNIEVAGPVLAASLGELGLVDVYELYVHPIVLGGGAPFFASSRPPLRYVGAERVGETVLKLTYVPA